MHRAPVVGNAVVAARMEKRRQELHRQNLRAMKPQIDTTEPKFRYLSFNAKRAQLEEDHYRKIEIDNQKLLRKMNHIMEKRSPLDNHNETFQLRSLNYGQRRKELRKIGEENLAILKRIEQGRPHYSTSRIMSESFKHDYHLESICKYPLIAPLRASSPLRRTPSPSSLGGGRTKPSTRASSVPPPRRADFDDTDNYDDDQFEEERPDEYHDALSDLSASDDEYQSLSAVKPPPKAASAKPTAAAKPAETKPADAKPADAKPAEAKPADAKPADVKPAEAKPIDAKPADVKSAEAKPVDAKPAEAKPAETKPVETKPVE
eukprot:TRINITY_DN5082_c0_g2_i9.p1 TRINITY_DN5082_c0_g2~~TRINITY_DN5082_c0_g2_i9.p1  ORF type:complete len:319 (+),score=65.61 TRINITY_DN5082_c0_g2_i9:51-1007(+)